jgi:hypothetical protein
MSLQLIAGSGASHADGSLSFTMKNLRSGVHVAVAITADALIKLRGDGNQLTALEQYHGLIEQTASKKYDDTGQPRDLKLTDTDFVGA